jgi:endonuclease/exonuclease/phosphatase family metal-dependent hydrolase
VLTWNLFHGRSVPPAGRSLLSEFRSALGGWDWDVALLQEVPPWWAQPLAVACEGFCDRVLTSRNWGLALRRALAERRPDLVKSNGGGANLILVRGEAAPLGCLMLRVWPERRVAHAVRLREGSIAVNFHGSARVPLAREELTRLWDWGRRLAGHAPLVLGGDLNLRDPEQLAPPGALHVGRRDVDHIFAIGLQPAGEPELLPRRVSVAAGELELSDHPPLLARLAPLG